MMNVLAIKGPKRARRVAQLWIIRKLEYATLVMNQYLSYIIKLCWTIDNCVILCTMLKKQGNLGKEYNLSAIEIVINILTKPDRV